MVTSGRARLAAESTGHGGRDVLLLHAGVTDQRSWGPLRKALDDDARCLSFDARGFGRTEYEPENGWSRVADAAAVLDAFEAPSAVVVGASQGGRTALDLAIAHPDLVSVLVLIGAAITGAPEPEVEPEVEELDAELEAAEERGDWDTVNELEARLWLDGPLASPGRVGADVRVAFLTMNGQALRAPDPGEQDSGVVAWDRLAEIAVPTLVLVGELDLLHVRHNAAHAAEQIPGARLVTLTGVAHLPHLEGDPTTLQEITGFVRSQGT